MTDPHTESEGTLFSGLVIAVGLSIQSSLSDNANKVSFLCTRLVDFGSL